MISKRVRQLSVAVVLALMAAATAAADPGLAGAGGTAIYPVLANRAAQYRALTGVAVNYQPIGSGGGIQRIETGTVAFANSDMPLPPTTVTLIEKYWQREHGI